MSTYRYSLVWSDIYIYTASSRMIKSLRYNTHRRSSLAHHFLFAFLVVVVAEPVSSCDRLSVLIPWEKSHRSTNTQYIHIGRGHARIFHSCNHQQIQGSLIYRESYFRIQLFRSFSLYIIYTSIRVEHQYI